MTFTTNVTRHRPSTSMYSLTFRVRVITSPQYGRNGTAHNGARSRRVDVIAGEGEFAGMLSAWHCVRRAAGLADYRWALIFIVLP